MHMARGGVARCQCETGGAGGECEGVKGEGGEAGEKSARGQRGWGQGLGLRKEGRRGGGGSEEVVGVGKPQSCPQSLPPVPTQPTVQPTLSQILPVPVLGRPKGRLSRGGVHVMATGDA